MQRFILLLFRTLIIGPVYSAPSIQNLTSLIDRNQFARAAQTGEQLLASNPSCPNPVSDAYAYPMKNYRRNSANRTLLKSLPVDPLGQLIQFVAIIPQN